MTAKYPIDYELTPRRLDVGRRWVTLELANVGEEELVDLDVRLNSLDAYNIEVQNNSLHIGTLEPDEEETWPVRVWIERSGSVYASIDGWRDGEPFHWESHPMRLSATGEAAEIVSLFALSHPYARLGEPIACEATVRGIDHSQGLVLEFWAETPTGEFKSLAKEGLDALAPGEVVRHTFEVTPREEGIYALHAYLYDGPRRIGHRREYLSISL
jgi:hypothetical protein